MIELGLKSFFFKFWKCFDSISDNQKSHDYSNIIKLTKIYNKLDDYQAMPSESLSTQIITRGQCCTMLKG